MSLRVVVDPYVALAILDHYMRRPELADPEPGKSAVPDRVTGILLGTTVKSDVLIRNWSPSMDLTTIDLIQRSNPTELGVGWYTSQFLKDDVEGMHKTIISKGIARPVILTVETPTEKSTDVTFRAFQTVNVTLGETEKPVVALKELPCVVESTDNGTNVAVDTIVSQLFPEEAQASDPARLSASTSGEDTFAELQQMRSNLQVARTYVNDCVNGKRAADKQTLRAIHELLVTNRVAAASAGVVQEKLQDTMMLMYLGKVLEAQVAKLQVAAPLQMKGAGPSLPGATA
eukprot:CAMPEP_0174829436 /NCGR_PEP_ID=MMETSP1114-20130205/1927_1 /TAXON_ID=312471 /ORGANISM="Neobodo designis, Strain CCAP 1951/1" /LENGTH=287 /DNA_ID=CAMNT_0016063183 /DNA_START=55 /DNA_END=918 /DNA_ORIENTATION=-